jgi:Bifunctional DNA primase/polymerase, N-terminal
VPEPLGALPVQVLVSPGGGMTNPYLLAAGSYVACGLTPIALRHRDKRPAIDWKKMQGVRLVERDWDEVDRYLHSWWDRPDPYNVGVLTGAEIYLDETTTSRPVVVDVDDDAARALVERTCDWPKTPTVRTAHGWHLWLHHHDAVGNRAKVPDVGLDVRGLGGYCVCPPSIHPSGREYEWDVGISWREDDRHGIWPPAPMPMDLAELLWPARPAVNGNGALAPILTDRYVQVALEQEVATVISASEGTRNDQLNRSAYALARLVRGGHLSPEVFVSELTSAALATGLGEGEVRKTLASALRGRT